MKIGAPSGNRKTVPKKMEEAFALADNKAQSKAMKVLTKP